MGPVQTLRFGPRTLRAAYTLHVHEAPAGRREGVRIALTSQQQRLDFSTRRRSQPSLVHGRGNEAAEVGMHSARFRKEYAPLGRHRRMIAQKVLKRGHSAAARMRPLDWLRELHLVADQHDVARGHAPCANISETDHPSTGTPTGWA